MAAELARCANLRVLIVEDDERVAAALGQWLRKTGADPCVVGTLRAALAALHWPPDVIVLDVGLPDGSGLDVAEAASRTRSPPRIIATSGSATAEQAFRLARLHVAEFMAKPYDLATLQERLFALPTATTELTRASARCVGTLDLPDVQDLVRRSMVERAMASASGNLTHAAELLGVTRQAVQAAMKGARPLPPAVPVAARRVRS